MGRSSSAIGQAGETLAARHLTDRGVRIIARNVRTRAGEIDLIGQAEGVLIFVEVRLRRGNRHGGAGASITPAKQRRIITTARAWLGARAVPCRFDAVLIDGEPARITWLRDAFRADPS
jgi:putative endonuclease